MSDGPYDVLARDWDKLNKAYDKLEARHARLRKAVLPVSRRETEFISREEIEEIRAALAEEGEP